MVAKCHGHSASGSEKPTFKTHEAGSNCHPITKTASVQGVSENSRMAWSKSHYMPWHSQTRAQSKHRIRWQVWFSPRCQLITVDRDTRITPCSPHTVQRNVLLACGALGKVSIVREPLRGFVAQWRLLVDDTGLLSGRHGRHLGCRVPAPGLMMSVFCKFGKRFPNLWKKQSCSH
jgi:hypothetical protein